MKFVRYAETEIKSRGINHRVGSFRYKDLGEGVPGTPGNFFLRMVWSETDFFSPRHLHNFDQVRVQVQGEFDFATDGTMKPGYACDNDAGIYFEDNTVARVVSARPGAKVYYVSVVNGAVVEKVHEPEMIA